MTFPQWGEKSVETSLDKTEFAYPRLPAILKLLKDNEEAWNQTAHKEELWTMYSFSMKYNFFNTYHILKFMKEPHTVEQKVIKSWCPPFERQNSHQCS